MKLAYSPASPYVRKVNACAIARGIDSQIERWKVATTDPALVERAIRNSSKTRDIVLDVFGGSGSTLIAAEKTGRQARLVELDPAYVDTILLRWCRFTGRAVTLDGDGRSYDEIAAARCPAAA